MSIFRRFPGSQAKGILLIQVESELYRIQACLLRRASASSLTTEKFAIMWNQGSKPNGEWHQLISVPIHKGLESNWDNLRLVGQWKIVDDLKRLREHVETNSGIRTPKDFRRFIVKCLDSRVRFPIEPLSERLERLQSSMTGLGSRVRQV